MMQVLGRMADVIPEASRTPLGLLAFVALVGTILVIGFRTRRLAILTKSLRDLPEGERRRALEIEINQPLPGDISAGDWIKHQVYKFILIGFLALVLLGAFLAALYALGSGGPYLPPPEPVAREVMSKFFARSDDNQVYDSWIDANKVQYGSLSGFREAANKVRKQLIEAPVQRTALSDDATPSHALVIFKSETDSGMVWREQVELHAVDGKWKMNSFYISPMDWWARSLPFVSTTLGGFASSTLPSEGLIPPSGWTVRTVSAPTNANEARTVCDVEVEADNVRAMMKRAYGACQLEVGTSLMVLGIATKGNEAVSMSAVRFYPI